MTQIPRVNRNMKTERTRKSSNKLDTSRNKDRILDALFILSLIMSVVSFLTAFPSVQASGGGTVVRFNMNPIQVPEVPEGELSRFTLTLLVDKVTEMGAFSGVLRYDTRFFTVKPGGVTTLAADLICTSAAVCDSAAPTISDGLGEVGFETFLTGFPRGFTGSGGLVRINFNVDLKGDSLLITPETRLLDIFFNDIPHTDRASTFFVNQTPVADAGRIATLSQVSALL